MAMKRWNKTVMEWECPCGGLDTNIPVTDWHDPKEKFMHTVTAIEATALPDRDAKIELHIQRVAISPTTERKKILDLLVAALRDKATVKNEGMYSNAYIVEFSLDNGDQFCDTVIDLMTEIFKALGVDDDNGYRLADFTVAQETFIQLDDAWLPFARWLRIKHRLPIYCSEDARGAARAS